jgi:hypothetical protein
MYLAFFEGICGPRYSEMWSATIDDIEGDKIKLVTGREVNISAKLKEIAGFAAEEKTYQSYSKTGRQTKFTELEPPNLIFKTVKRGSSYSTNINDQITTRRFSLSRDYLGLPSKFTIKNLLLSGKIYMIKNIINETGLSVEEVIIKYKDKINAQYDAELIKTPGEFMRRYKEFFAE